MNLRTISRQPGSQTLTGSAPNGEVTLAAKVRFLADPDACSGPRTPVMPIETHMSWVFLAGERAYKLKKPVRLPYLDFSTLRRREAACRAELRLNRRLAPEVYLAVEPLVRRPTGLAIGGAGEIIDWLVVMRRLDEAGVLQTRLANHARDEDLDRLAVVLARFYRRAGVAWISPAAHLADWREALAYNRRILLEPRFDLPRGLVRWIDQVLRRFLATQAPRLVRRVLDRRILDGHGDLRPEHIWIGEPIQIIDCLEFSSRLRASDPLDEIAFLDLECERLGAPAAGARLRHRVVRALGEHDPEPLYSFYRCHRAMLRARLSIAHLLDAHARTPEKWPAQARRYIELAAADALKVQRRLRASSKTP